MKQKGYHNMSILFDLKHCLWEAYYVDYRKNARNEINTSSNEEKLDIINNSTLSYFFLRRRELDIGFYTSISSMILEDLNANPRLLNLTRLALSKAFIENSDVVSNELYKIRANNFTHKSDTLKNKCQKINSQYKKMEDFPPEWMEKLIFLKARREIAKEANDNEDFIVISSRLSEFELKIKNLQHNRSKSSQFYKPLNEPSEHILFQSSFYLGGSYTDKWKFISKRYSIENIKFLELYHRPSELINNSLIFSFYEHPFLISRATMMLHDLNLKSNYESKIKSSHIVDVIKILHFIWFNEKSEEEKKSILNQYYPFKINLKIVDEHIEFAGDKGIELAFSVAKGLNKNGYINESKTLLQHLIVDLNYNFNESITDTLESQNIDTQKSFDKCYYLVERLFESFQFDAAIPWFKVLLKHNGKNSIMDLMPLVYYKSENNESNQNVQIFLEDTISSYPEEILVHVYLGLIELLNDDFDLSIERFQEAINLAFKNGISYPTYDYLLPLDNDTNKMMQPPKIVSYVMVIRLLMKELLLNDKKEYLLSLIKILGETVSKYYGKSMYYTDIGSAFTDFGFFSDGVDYYNKALSLASSNETKAMIHTNIGSNYANQDMHSDAIFKYKKAIELDDNNPATWRDKAFSEFYLANYKEALASINRAIECTKNNAKMSEKAEHYEIFKKSFEDFTHECIGFESIVDDDVKNILFSAESLLFNLYEKSDKIEVFDFSLVLVAYGKAIETMLHYNVSLKIKQEILQNRKYKKYFHNSGTILYKYSRGKQSSRLPFTLLNIIEDERTISLGQWAFFDKDLANNNPIVKSVSEYIDENLHYDMKIIVNTCGNIYKIRNGSAHKGTKPREEVMEIRDDIIQSINELISTIYNNPR